MARAARSALDSAIDKAFEKFTQLEDKQRSEIIDWIQFCISPILQRFTSDELFLFFARPGRARDMIIAWLYDT